LTAHADEEFITTMNKIIGEIRTSITEIETHVASACRGNVAKVCDQMFTMLITRRKAELMEHELLIAAMTMPSKDRAIVTDLMALMMRLVVSRA
jgi:hypothetical protein